MKILVTAGNTQVPIDRVRAITNVFTGRTGAQIALRAQGRGHDVTLLTSHPEAVTEVGANARELTERWRVLRYRTFDELRDLMAGRVREHGLQAIIHSAAVSDYEAAGIYAAAPGAHFCVENALWESVAGPPKLTDMSAGKVKSDAPELWLRLVRTPKLVDLVRSEWGFRGILVKFKLEVGISEEQLLVIAERSRVHSSADLMVANTLEGAPHWAYIGLLNHKYERVSRRELADRLLDAVEALHRERSHA